MTPDPIPHRVTTLEDAFRRYPDLPPEILVKADLLTLGHWFTDAALDAAAGATVKSYRLFSYDRIPMSAMSRRENRRVPEHFTILGGLWGLRPVNVQTSLDPDSPYLLDVVDGRLVLTAHCQVLCEVRFPRAPAYYAQRLPDGTPFHEIIAFGSFVTAFRACQYWGDGEECRFCDINENVRQMKRSRDFTLTMPVKRLDDVVTVAEAIVAEQRATHGPDAGVSFVISGGTITSTLHGQDEDTFYGAYVEALKAGDPRRHIALQTNAKSRDALSRYRALGLNQHHADMEVWDRRLFEWLVPGKARRVGWDAWVRSLVESAEIFGPGETSPLFVAGIELARPHGFDTVEEAVASTTEGMAYLMSRGVLVRFQHWRREYGSSLFREAHQPPVPLDYYALLERNRYALWKQHALPLPNTTDLMLAPRRHLGRTHGTYEDHILLRENAYPPDLLEIIDRRSVPWRDLA